MSDLEVISPSPQNTSIAFVAQHQVGDLWDEFLRLQISTDTRRTYAAAIDNFFLTITGSRSNPTQIAEFLRLTEHQAIAIVLKYKADLLDLNLAPSTINVRLSAIKSLVNHARKLGRCGFNLTDIPNVKVRTYRDTTGVKPSVFKSMLEGIEREGTSERKSIMGKRDYALLRLLWDNALRRGEIGGLTIGCFRDGKLWIKGKGHTQREAVDLSPKTVKAIEDWLSVRGTQEDLDPLFIALDNQSFGKSLSTRSIDRIVKKAAERVNVTKVLSPHRIRHSSITAFLDASGGDVRKAQKLSRHRQISTLMIYDDNRQGQQGEASTVLADLV